VVCGDPVSAALGYLPIFAPERIRVTDHMTSVSCGTAALRFMAADGLPQVYRGRVLQPMPMCRSSPR